MSVAASPTYSVEQRRVALAWGLACHASFGLGVTAMMLGLYFGMGDGFGPFHGTAALVADLMLLAQFPVVHSLLLSKQGRAWISRLAPMGLGPALGTTTYALIASWQLLATFVLWSPFGVSRWSPHGAALAVATVVYAGAWLILLKAMADAGLGVQTGYLGWGSVFQGRAPVFRGFDPRGMFRWVRQPVYVAFALTLWTAPVWTADHLLVAVAWTAYCVLAPRHKERRYLAQYGERFARYRTRVPYWIPTRRPADLADLASPSPSARTGRCVAAPALKRDTIVEEISFPGRAEATSVEAMRDSTPPPAEPARRARTSSIVAVAGAHPPHHYSQEQLLESFRSFWGGKHHNPARLEALHRSVCVGGRNLALAVEDYPKLGGFGDANDAYIRVGTDIAAEALSKALAAAGLQPRDVDAIFFASVTGIAVPSIDARLINRLGLRPDVKRTPIFGLGCVAGAAGIARVHDYLLAWPDHVAVLVSVELCSLTLQRDDFSIPNLIASGLFGDGAAAVVMTGAARAAGLGGAGAGPWVLATRSRFYPDTERVMGWDIGDSGFRIVLSAGVPDVVRDFLGDDVRDFLRDHGVERESIQSWVCHPGGPKVLDAFEETLGLGPDDLALTRRSLAEVGNMSSSSVLYVLGDTIAERRPPAGTLGLILALGPGFCSELVLVEW